MQSGRYLIGDLHAHPSLKPFRQLPQASMWERIAQSGYCKPELLPGIAKDITKTIATTSQTNLQQCLEGNVRAVVNGLYIPERQMFELRNLADWLTADEKEINMGACVSGFAREVVAHYFEQHKNKGFIDYFTELKEEYQFIASQESAQTANLGGFRLASDINSLKDTLTNEGNTVVGMLSLEGLHSLGQFESYNDLEVSIKDLNNPQSKPYNHYLQMYERHIDEIKQWGGGRHTPLYATCTHFFWNMVCGHARTAAGANRTFGINQSFGINEGFTGFGKQVIHRLLSRDNGRRILIDVKHMSCDARTDFYRIWQEEYHAKGDSLPIICSHAAVNGIPQLNDCRNEKDNKAEYEETYFNTWSINLTDEDIKYIFASGGLIGFIMQTDRIAGGITKDLLEKLPNKDERRDEYARMYLTNMFHVVKICNDRRAWDLVTLGTDYDGLVNPFESYPAYADFQLLAQHIYQFFERPLDNPYLGMTRDDFKWLMFGYTPEELTRKIMFGNLEQFFEKHYHDQYLLHPVTSTLPPVM